MAITLVKLKRNYTSLKHSTPLVDLTLFLKLIQVRFKGISFPMHLDWGGGGGGAHASVCFKKSISTNGTLPER